jgi:putative endonuclease
MPMPETLDGDTGARRRLGASGERVASGWLEARGYRILARNWRCPYGELDLVAEHDGELVFVEVKTRRGLGHGAPEEAVTPAKRRRLIAAAQSYLVATAQEDHPYCIDVVAVDLGPAGAFRGVRHFPRSIEAEE